MEALERKARNYFITGEISERFGAFDVACTNYFKSLAAINDFLLAKLGLFPKDHSERFDMLKANLPELYRMASSLFLTYRRTYTREISGEETKTLKSGVKEAFRHAKIEPPTDVEIEACIEKASRR